MIITPSMARLAQQMKHHAETGLFTGSNDHAPYFRLAHQQHYETGASILFTRDMGMHDSGWFKNPDYNQCYHLSLKFFDFEAGEPAPFEFRIAKAWIKAFYGNWSRYIWEESGHYIHLPGEVRHYRVMTDRAWQPIIPRGEVYTKDFIEKGWQSWSDQQWEKGKLP